jgi:hypothetical protein
MVFATMLQIMTFPGNGSYFFEGRCFFEEATP